ncbi:MAG: hypothetical protein IPH20_00860 [Bacteroidales bacterium]|nr:hypothetical protein [Bacteroidales bacterium]
MKQTVYLLLLFIFGFTCPDKEISEAEIKETMRDGGTTYIHIDKLSVTGDFDGDGKTDTLVQNNISKITGQSIDSIPYFNDWDSLVQFIDSIGSDVVLTMLNGKSEPLHLGSAFGLYCLINIGDNNKDKKDEVALVVDYCDFSSCNICFIYTLCENKWVTLKSFGIHESAFDYEGETQLNGTEIEGFLEFREKQWMYIDYYKWFEAKKAKDTTMNPLRIKKGC